MVLCQSKQCIIVETKLTLHDFLLLLLCFSVRHKQCDGEEASVRAAISAVRLQQRRLPTCPGRARTLQGAQHVGEHSTTKNINSPSLFLLFYDSTVYQRVCEFLLFFYGGTHNGTFFGCMYILFQKLALGARIPPPLYPITQRHSTGTYLISK